MTDTFAIGQRVSRGYHGLGTVVEICADASNGYIVQMDAGDLIMAAGYLLRAA